MSAEMKEQGLDLRETLYDQAAEEGLVGSALINPEVLDDPSIVGTRPSYFFIEKLGRIWKAEIELYHKGKDIDLITVAQVLKSRKQLKAIGGQAFLTQLANSIPSSVHAGSYAEIVTGFALRRSLYDKGADIVKAADSAKSPDEILNKLHSEIGDLRLSYLGVDGYRPLEWEELEAVIPDVRWLWPGQIPRGHNTVLVGAPDKGKSALALTLAARVGGGGSWPDGTLTKETGRVAWLDTESMQGINIKRRKWFGVPDGCLVVPSIGHDPFADITLTSESGWLAFETACRSEGVLMAVVDSLGGASLEENKPQIKIIMRRLASLALELDIGMLIVHHPRKLGLGEYDTITLDRVRGHSSIVQFARSIIALETPDPAIETVRVKSIKNNFGEKPEPVGFKWAGNMLSFGDAPREPKAETLQDQGVNLLQVLLKDGPVRATQIYDEAEQAGMSKKTIKRAKAAVGILALQRGGHWYWALSTPEENEDAPWWLES